MASKRATPERRGSNTPEPSRPQPARFQDEGSEKRTCSHSEHPMVVESMKYESTIARSLLLTLGAIVGAVAADGVRPASSLGAAHQNAPSGETPTLEDLRGEIDRLKSLVPSQSHPMADVGYHFANLWFAGQRQNWDLARFYFAEARSHVQWSIRIRPVRKAPDGYDVDLQGIFDGIDASVFGRVSEAIEEKDRAKFDAAYRTSLEACYACHKAAGKPYLRPMVPLTPPQSIINFDPRAAWP